MHTQKYLGETSGAQRAESRSLSGAETYKARMKTDKNEFRVQAFTGNVIIGVMSVERRIERAAAPLDLGGGVTMQRFDKIATN